MSTQPNALRLADELTIVHNGHADEGPSTFSESAAELRAQHGLIGKLTDALETCRHVLLIEGLAYTADIAKKAIAAAEAHK